MTKAQMQRRIEKSPLHLNRTRDFKTIYFDDKGLRLSCDDNEGYCLIETSAHTHVFRSITVAGVSRPYLYTKRFIEFAVASGDRDEEFFNDIFIEENDEECEFGYIDATNLYVGTDGKLYELGDTRGLE